MFVASRLKNVLRHLSAASIRPVIAATVTRPFSSSCSPTDEFAGLTLAHPNVQRFLETLSKEHTDLARSEQRNRAGHRRLATLGPLLQILDARNETLHSLEQLHTEMSGERDKELLALIEEEKNVWDIALGTS